MNRSVIMWRVASFAVAAGFIALWQLIANLKLVSPVFLPGPDRAWASLVRGFSSGDLWSKLAGTLEHMAYGWLAASIIGVAIGAIIGSSRTMRTYVAPSLEFLRPLPVSAIIPVAIAMLGLTQAMALFVIAFGAIWPIMLAQQALRPDLMLAYLVWIGIIGYALNVLLTVAQRRLFGRAALSGDSP